MLRLTNTLGGKKEEFRPVADGPVRMYHCGPTVKDAIDISKFRSYLLADVLRRKLEADGHEVRQVMNITDVGHLNEFEEDLVEIAAARTGLYAWELVEKEERIFHDDRRALLILDAQEYPRAHDHIDDMIGFIQDLEAKGATYRAGGNIYLDVAAIPRCGQLSGCSREELERTLARSRTPSHAEKRHPLDIDLWRTDIDHQRHWPSPWGRGFPGWHVECAAMGRKYLGESFDIHTGAHDNVFPHHECEAAQAEALSGKPLARFWLHSAPVNVDGVPMRPGNRNVVTVRELLEAGFRGTVVRAALLDAHYREPLEFGDDCIDRARDNVNAVEGFYHYLRDEVKSCGDKPRDDADADWIAATRAGIDAALDDDLDWPRAVAEIVSVIDRLEPDEVGDPRRALAAIVRWDRVLGLLEPEPGS